MSFDYHMRYYYFFVKKIRPAPTRRCDLLESRILRTGICRYTGLPWVYGLLQNWPWTIEERLYLLKYSELEPYLDDVAPK